MRLSLQSVSQLRQYFGDGEVEIEFGRSTVAELMEQLARDYRYDPADHAHTMVFVNGRGCVDFSWSLKDGDRIAIIPVLAAG